MYKFETHLHSSGCSACAISDSLEFVDAAKNNGYSGIVFTNHFYHGNTAIDRSLPWKDFVNAYEYDYIKAKEYGDKNNIEVFFGLEEVYSPGKEMLIYGLTPDNIKQCPEFKYMNPYEITEFVHQNGGVTVCAHPFRERVYIPNPNIPPDISLFDGIECYNHFNRPEENQKAFEFTQKTSLFKSAGGDIHRVSDFGVTGIAFKKSIKSYKDFIKQLKSENYRLLIP